jgi:ADP-ribosylglycohydrolase
MAGDAEQKQAEEKKKRLKEFEDQFNEAAVEGYGRALKLVADAKEKGLNAEPYVKAELEALRIELLGMAKKALEIEQAKKKS